MTDSSFYPVGTPGVPWGTLELAQWRSRQSRLRRYDVDVVPRIDALADRYERIEYGQLAYDGERYALLALRDRTFDPALPTALLTGGVHGYETSEVLGALDFLETDAADYAGKVNLLAVPCVSPWAYERINRWNYDAIDPNRNFRADGPAREATALIQLVHSTHGRFLLHIDLHETTDSDESEFGPARAARDGKTFEPGLIPDGFYLVDDTENPLKDLSLCPSITGARYTTTTEVYPDSTRTTPEECVRAQVAAVRAALDYALAHS